MLHETLPGPVKAVLAGLDTGLYDATGSMEELALLAESAEMEVAASFIQSRPTPNGATYIGEGKLEEIAHFCASSGAQIIVCDDELTAVQLRNIEKKTDTAVIDRTMLILDIFAQRAHSKEGKIQVELAQQKYRLPRLAGIGTALSRLGAGIGTRGPGETKLETDRRHMRRRIQSLEENLKEVSLQSIQTRRKRNKNETPSVSIVGYTNAGKSTLLNTLTGAGVLSEDKLFATLDPTARALALPEGGTAVFIDTVGFISRLPHHLIEAFKSTLEEAVEADVVLHLCDISNPDFSRQYEVTEKLLAELGCDKDKILTVLNKADLIEPALLPHNLPAETVLISAKTGQGIETLLEEVKKKLSSRFVEMTLRLPYSESALAARIHSTGKVYKEDFTPDGIVLQAQVHQKMVSQIEDFQI